MAKSNLGFRTVRGSDRQIPTDQDLLASFMAVPTKMRDEAFQLLAHFIAVVATFAFSALAWQTANRLAYGIPPTIRKSRWLAEQLLASGFCIFGLVVMLIAIFSLFSALSMRWPPFGMAPFAVGLSSFSFVCTVWQVVRIRRATVGALKSESGGEPDFDIGAQTRATRPAWLQSPFGVLILLTLVNLAAAAGLSAIAVAPNQRIESLIFSSMFAVALGIAVTSIGVAFQMATQMIHCPGSKEERGKALVLARLLRLGAVLLSLAALVSTLFFSLIIMVMAVILAISVASGQLRTAQLSVFWLLANSAQEQNSLLSDLKKQRVAAKGRVRHLLNSSISAIERETTWIPLLCGSGVVPSGSQLELCGAGSVGKLAAALEQAAVRETERFSRQCDPAAPRAIMVYFGALILIATAVMTFIGYSIIPKFKKIFEDFGTDLSPFSRTMLTLFSSELLLVLLGTLGVAAGLSALAGEFLIDFFGWQGFLERIGWSRRHRTSDLLRGLRWAVLANQPLDKALMGMSSAPMSRSSRARLLQTANAIQQGLDPWESLHQANWITRPDVELLQSAQVAGNLPWTLDMLSETQTDRSEIRFITWLQFVHPLVILLFAGIVGLFTAAVLYPMVELVILLPI